MYLVKIQDYSTKKKKNPSTPNTLFFFVIIVIILYLYENRPVSKGANGWGAY